MALVPSFSAYARGPQLAEAYLGAERIRQQAASDAARVSLGYAQIAQNRQEAEMQLAAQKEIAAAQAIKQAQEAEVERAYKDTQFGLQERNLKVQEAASQRLLQEAKRDFERQQEYARLQQKFQADAIAQGKPIEEAAQYGARMAMLQLGWTGAASAMNEPREPSPYPGLSFELRKLNDEEQAIRGNYPSFFRVENYKPEDRSALEGIKRRRSQLQVPSGVSSTRTATNAPAMRVVRDASGKLVIQR